jgi:hypothetical protein
VEFLGICFLLLLFIIPFVKQRMRDKKNEETYRREPKFVPLPPQPKTAKVEATPIAKPIDTIIAKKEAPTLSSLKKGLIFSMILKNPYHEETSNIDAKL